MEAIRPNDKLQCRSIWISDVHLGSRHSKANELLQLFERIEFETLYLVGDIVDLLAMKRRVHWPNTHNKVLREIMKLSRREGSRVVYVPGNHDYALGPWGVVRWVTWISGDRLSISPQRAVASWFSTAMSSTTPCATASLTVP